MIMITRFILGLSLICAELSVSTAIARTVDSARQAGEVVEGDDGYLQAKSNDAAVAKFVAEVNQKRRETYQQIANKNKQDVTTVAREAAQKLKNK